MNRKEWCLLTEEGGRGVDRVVTGGYKGLERVRGS